MRPPDLSPPAEPLRRPTIGFIGIHSNGRPDMPVSQNETIARLFAESGFVVRKASGVRRPALRTIHQMVSIPLWRDVDVLVIAGFSGPSFFIVEFATWLARVTGKRSVVFLHGGRLPEFGPEHRRRVEAALARADRVFAPSEFLAREFRSWGIDVRVIPNVLSIDRYVAVARAEARPRILWMRTFHEHYDPLTAVRTFARLVEHHSDAAMTMAGADQGLLDATRGEAARLGVVDRIEFPGYLRGDEKDRALQSHDFFLNTNVVDNMPVSVLEAAASGMVPVATAVGGIPMLLTDGVDALLSPPGDDAALAADIESLVADPSRYGEMSRAARRLAELSGWPHVRERWLHELELLLPGRTVP